MGDHAICGASQSSHGANVFCQGARSVETNVQVIVSARHMEMTPPLHDYVDQKLVQAVARVLDDPAVKIHVELIDMAHAKHGVRMECNVKVSMPTPAGHGDVVVIHEADDNMYKAIDEAHRRLVLQVKRHRDKHRASTHRQKNAAAERAVTARQQLTSEQEPWEQEAAAFERSSASA